MAAVVVILRAVGCHRGETERDCGVREQNALHVVLFHSLSRLTRQCTTRARCRQSAACQSPPAGNWTECRRLLIAEMFGTSNGTLPSRSDPDWIVPQTNYTMNGWPSAGQGCPASASTGGGSRFGGGRGGGGEVGGGGEDVGVSWRNNLTALVWKLDPLPPLASPGALCPDSNACVYFSTASASGHPLKEWRFDGDVKTAGAIIHTPTGKCLAPTIAAAHGRVELQTCQQAAGNQPVPQQAWLLETSGQVKSSANQADSLCLNVFMPLTKYGGEAQLYPCSPPSTAEPNERWVINATDGTLRSLISPGARGLTLAVRKKPHVSVSQPSLVLLKTDLESY